MVVNPTKRKRSKTVRKKSNARRKKRRRTTTTSRRSYRRRRPVAVAVANPKKRKYTKKKRKYTKRKPRKTYVTRVTRGKPKYHILKQNPEQIATQSNPAKTTWELVQTSFVSAAAQSLTQLLTGYVKTKVNKEGEETKTNMMVEVGVPLGVVAGSAFLSKGKNPWLNSLAIGASTVLAENAMTLLLANIDKSGNALTYQKLGSSKESIGENLTIVDNDNDDDDTSEETPAPVPEQQAMEGFGNWRGEGEYGGSNYRSRYLLGRTTPSTSRFLGAPTTVNRFLGSKSGSNRFLGQSDNYNDRYKSISKRRFRKKDVA